MNTWEGVLASWAMKQKKRDLNTGDIAGMNGLY